MLPAADQAFVTASTQASAALIGLLFVSVSLAPERVFGTGAEAGRQGQALSAFTALANVFFVSFGALIPDVPLGPLVMLVALVAESQTLSLLWLVPRWRSERRLVPGLALFAVSAVLYLGELEIGVALWAQQPGQGLISGLFEILLGAYGIGLVRAWELLGAPGGRGVVARGVGWVAMRLRPGHAPSEPDDHGAAST